MSRVQEESRLAPDLSTPWVLPSGPRGVTVARKATVHQLAQLGVEDRNAIDTIELLVSELTSNVVKHADGRSTLTILRHGDVVRIEVCDSNPDDAPVEQRMDRQSVSGRGLLLVSNLATSWGYEREASNKITWAEVDLQALA